VKENRAIGEGSEFHQLRDFVPGMDVKTIDWKRSARRRALVAKEQRAERNHHVIVALDNGYLMREEIAGLPKIDHAITAALATAWAAAIGGDLVGFYSYDVRPRDFAARNPAAWPSRGCALDRRHGICQPRDQPHAGDDRAQRPHPQAQPDHHLHRFRRHGLGRADAGKPRHSRQAPPDHLRHPARPGSGSAGGARPATWTASPRWWPPTRL
jgi:hypothetical protein